LNVCDLLSNLHEQNPQLLPIKILTTDDITDGETRYIRAIKKEVLLHNAFPESMAQETTMNILKELHEITDPENRKYRYTTTLRMTSLVTKTASKERTKCQTAVKHWLNDLGCNLKTSEYSDLVGNGRKLYYHLCKAYGHRKVKSDKGKTYGVGSIWDGIYHHILNAESYYRKDVD
ncbi:hypothetical protein BDA99DRAFT_544549, partial [Phascolomyces articulosus]